VRITRRNPGNVITVETVPVNPPAATPPGDEVHARAGWQLSPLVPAVGVALLALLWLLSAAGGWATAAFCSGQAAGASCRAHVAASVRPSALAAVVAVALAVAALLAPSAARSGAAAAQRLRLWLLAGSAACWVLALAVLFVAGEAASH
jgi:hypothetical protein